MITATVILSLITLLVVTDPYPIGDLPSGNDADGVASEI